MDQEVAKFAGYATHSRDSSGQMLAQAMSGREHRLQH